MLRLFSLSGEGKDNIVDLLSSYFDEEPEAVSPGCDLGYSIGKFLVLKNISQQVQKLYTEVSLDTSRWCRKTAQEALPLPCAFSSCCVSRRSSRRL